MGTEPKTSADFAPTNRAGTAPKTLLNFAGKTVAITGTSSGMGAAALRRFVDAKANVHTIDINGPADDPAAATGVGPQPTHHRCDLADQASIDETVVALPDRIDVLINCAGVPNGGRFSGQQVMAVNWLGLRHLTESLLPRLEDGGSVVHVASTAGRDWQSRVAVHNELMSASTFADGLKWLEANPDVFGDGYVLSKEAVQYYTMWRSVQLLSRGIRMNSVCPGITDTGIINDFRRGMGEQVIDHAAAVAGRIAEPDEMVPAMMFLADYESASYINGINLHIDRGTGAARASDQSDPELIWGSTS
ncbi:MAG: coniferyl-alcohol dehydrogenase [Acidimicrobiales bacterium]